MTKKQTTPGTALFAVIVAATITLGPILALAETTSEAQYERTLRVTRTTGTFKIDGQLSESGWATAARATGFVETSPADQVPPDVRSEAWITYDENNLYVAFILGQPR